jgi:hypothetical protein
MDAAADTLLAGPRGRRLLLAVAGELDPGLRSLSPEFAVAPLDDGVRTEFAGGLAAVDPDGVTAAMLWNGLAEAVGWARYWQPQDANDVALATLRCRDALRPLAEAVLAHPDSDWWSTPVALDAQRYVMWLDDTPNDPLEVVGAAGKLERWRGATLADERSARSRPSDPSAAVSGAWSSTPALASLPTSTRSFEASGPVGLTLVEDAFSWAEARVTPVSVAPGARVYEIDGPGALTALVERYPLDVSLSRRHDWYRTTGETGTWLIPDWQAVAADFDGVHLSVMGYLATAGRALRVGADVGAESVAAPMTVLAGWDPDRTFWLTDVLTEAHPSADWRRIDTAPARWVESVR